MARASSSSEQQTELPKVNNKNCDTVTLQKSKSCSDLSMKDFFDFFHTAYQLHKMVEGGSTNTENSQAQKLNEIDWNKLIDSPFVKKPSDDDESESSNQSSWASSEQSGARRKLHQALQEGLLDSVLPYLIPKHCGSAASSAQSTSSVNALSTKRPSDGKLRLNVATLQQQQQSLQTERSPVRRKHSQIARPHKTTSKPDVEVEIHVCDEVKGLKRTFRCPQRLLIAEMGYFAEVTAGQRLEDMDISVHCDVANFEWLMQWVKRDPSMKEGWPKLDCSNVVAVLTSAAFLQMDLLLETCLHFCYTKANEVLAGPANMACLNDSVLTRLAGMFSNAEVEQLRDRKDRLQGRLYCKLISSLAEPTPEEHRGHLASLARVFRCSECGKLVGSRSLAPRVACTPANTRLGRTGDLQHVHIRSASWSLSEHVAGLKAELRSWRRVYWRLWGEAHWLLCTRCGSPFPLSEAAWCRQHPEAPQFLGAPPQRACGRYTCCGARVLRFSPVTPQQGCQYESHAPELSTEKEQTVWNIFQEHMNLIVMPPPAMTNTSAERRARTPRVLEAGTTVEEETFVLPCLRLETGPSSPGLLAATTWELATSTKRDRLEGSRAQARTTNSQTAVDAPPPIAISSGARSSCSSSSSSSASSGDEGPEDEDEYAQACQPVRVTARPRTALLLLHATTPATAHRSAAGRHWDPGLTTRCNQDDQREYEERAARRLVNWLSRRSCATVHARSHAVTSTPLGGTFVALEREWRDTHLRPDKPATSSGRHRVRSSRLTS